MLCTHLETTGPSANVGRPDGGDVGDRDAVVEFVVGVAGVGVGVGVGGD